MALLRSIRSDNCRLVPYAAVLVDLGDLDDWSLRDDSLDTVGRPTRHFSAGRNLVRALMQIVFWYSQNANAVADLQRFGIRQCKPSGEDFDSTNAPDQRAAGDRVSIVLTTTAASLHRFVRWRSVTLRRHSIQP